MYAATHRWIVSGDEVTAEVWIHQVCQKWVRDRLLGVAALAQTQGLTVWMLVVSVVLEWVEVFQSLVLVKVQVKAQA